MSEERRMELYYFLSGPDYIAFFFLSFFPFVYYIGVQERASEHAAFYSLIFVVAGRAEINHQATKRLLTSVRRKSR